mgnify:CR=1 FL=1
MNDVLKNIINIIDVEKIETNLFRGQCHPSEHVFGGQVLAQAITAALRTVKSEHSLHSIHSYFLRPGDSSRPILFEVDPIRDGRSFSTRRVAAIQNGRAIFTLSSSWQKTEKGLVHSQPAPDVLPPEALRGDLETFKAGATAAFEVVVQAFAEGDTKALRGLLNDEVLDNFSTAIEGREKAGEALETTVISIKNADSRFESSGFNSLYPSSKALLMKLLR